MQRQQVGGLARSLVALIGVVDDPREEAAVLILGHEGRLGVPVREVGRKHHTAAVPLCGPPGDQERAGPGPGVADRERRTGRRHVLLEVQRPESSRHHGDPETDPTRVAGVVERRVGAQHVQPVEHRGDDEEQRTDGEHPGARAGVEDEPFEGVSVVCAEEGVVEAAEAVFLAEVEAKGFFGVAAAKLAVDAQASGKGNGRFPLNSHIRQRNRPFPLNPVFVRMLINAGCLVP